MPYLYVNDGTRDAQDDRANYIWYEKSDPRSLAAALDLASRRLAARRGTEPPVLPIAHRPLCHAG